MSRALVSRIFAHMEAQGWIAPGQSVIDVFGGVGTTAIEGASRGYRVTCIELEPRFFRMATGHDCEGFNADDYLDLCPSCMSKIKRDQFDAPECNVHLPPHELPPPHHFVGNFEMHRRVWDRMGDPQPVMICGDSRNAAALVRAHGVVTSPPFSGTEQPCASQSRAKKDYHAFTRGDGTKRDGTHVGETPGQLSALPEGECIAAIASPPYADSVDSQQHGIDWTKAGPATGNRKRGEGCKHEETLRNQMSYGSQDGQLGAMPDQGLDAAVTSPPFLTREDGGEPRQGWNDHVATSPVIDAAIASPPFASSDTKPTAMGSGKPTRADGDGAGRNKGDYVYGESSGQLGQMREGAVDAAITSPPYLEGLGHGGVNNQLAEDKNIPAALANNGYGGGDGNIANLKEGSVDASLASPPYAESPVTGESNFKSAKCPDSQEARHARGDGYGADVDASMSSPPYEGIRQDGGGDYAKAGVGGFTNYTGEPCDAWHTVCDPENLGNLGGEQNVERETFWSAAKVIVQQTYLLLRPGAYSAWVVKDYVKDGRRVPFCDNWARLCEACGFVVVQRARAWLVKEEKNPGLFGDVVRRTERKSFFRRLHEKRLPPGSDCRIDFEQVIFCRKPV